MFTGYAEMLVSVSDGKQANELRRNLAQQRENARAVCMRSEGFDYVAAPAESILVLGPDLNASSREFAEQYGFGFSTLDIDSQRAQRNPNDSMYTSLGSTEQQSWDQALKRCDAEVRASDVEVRLAQIAKTIHEIGAAVQSDPDYVDAVRAWRDCLVSKGFSFDARTPQELVVEFGQRYQSLDNSARDSFKREELETAVASWECRQQLDSVTNRLTRQRLSEADRSLFQAVYDGK